MKKSFIIIFSLIQISIWAQSKDTTTVIIPGEKEYVEIEERKSSPTEKGEENPKEKIIVFKFDKRMFIKKIRKEKERFREHCREKRNEWRKRRKERLDRRIEEYETEEND